MQIKISEPRYVQVMIDKCDRASEIESELLGHKYLINRVQNYAVSEVNRVYSDIGTLNISKKNKRLFQRLVDKCVCRLIKQDLQEQIELENTFLLKK
jgi:hypothetical protein